MTYKKEEKMKLGIDMGGMSIKMGLVNEENEIIGRITIPTDLTVPYQMLVERMADAVQQMLENAGMTLEQCEGIGIGSPGTIDAKRGVILYSNNFGWENVPIVEELKNLFIQDHSTAHTRSKCQKNCIFCTFCRTGIYFSQCRSVRIIGTV